jgi:predicted TIM-barrel fold metal-dependent hydrolase
MSRALKQIPVIDSFAFVDDPFAPQELEGFRRAQHDIGIRTWCFGGSNFCRELGVPDQNPIGLWLKRRFPEEVYFFASAASYSEQQTPTAGPAPEPPGTQVEALAEAGADGWKLMSGKPDRSPVPLDSVVNRPLYEALERRGLPLRWHVGDPIEFWDPQSIPRWARREWCYGPEHPRLDDLRRQALAVLGAFPRLTVIFGHFFFLGGELERAAELLRQFQNAYLDLVPGVEMYFAFSRDHQRARAFFVENSERILLGSYTSPARPPGPVVGMVRRFLETDESFDPPHGDPFMWPEDRGPIVGIALGERELENIYWRNWQRIVGPSPRPLDQAAARAFLARWRSPLSTSDLAGRALAAWGA